MIYFTSSPKKTKVSINMLMRSAVIVRVLRCLKVQPGGGDACT